MGFDLESRRRCRLDGCYGLLKKAFNASAGNSLDAQLELERDLQREAGLSQDYREGVAAFMQKRKPDYKGK